MLIIEVIDRESWFDNTYKQLSLLSIESVFYFKSRRI